MKTNEMNLQEMQQTNGGTAMPPMSDNPGADALTIRNNPVRPQGDPNQDTTASGDAQVPNFFGGDMFS